MSIKQIAILAVAVTGVVLTVWGIWLLHDELDMIHNWIPVPAAVTRSWAENRSGDDGDTTSFAVGYEFAFNYGGSDHHAKAYSPDTHSRTGADKLIAAHYVGSGGEIRVNPANPEDVNPNLGSNPATLAGPLWLILAGVTFVLLAPPLWLLAKPQDNW